MKNRFAWWLCVFAAVVVSVDVSPKAYEMLIAEGNEVWISNVYYT